MTELHPQDSPQITPTPLSAPFWDACARGELLFQRCTECAAAIFPPSEHCRDCLAGPPTWVRSAGLGTLYSWTIVHRPVTPAFSAPYAPAIVTLAEGYQMITNLVGTTGDQLRVDLPVQVVFHANLPYFEPA